MWASGAVGQAFSCLLSDPTRLIANAGAMVIASITIIKATTVNNITMRLISTAPFFSGAEEEGK